MRKFLLAAVAVAPLVSGCVAPAVMPSDSADPPGWHDDRQAPVAALDLGDVNDNPPPHDPRHRFRYGSKLRAMLLAVVAVAPLVSGCVGPALQSSDGDSPLTGTGWYHEEPQASAYVPPSSPVAAAPVQPDPPADTQANADPDSGSQQAAVMPGTPQLSASGTVHDLTDAAGGYIIGRQAEHLVKQTIQRRRLAAAAKEAAEVGGAGAAATRAATGGRAATALEGEGAAAAAGEGAAVAGGEGAAVARGGVAAGEALAGEGVVGEGFAAAAGEVLVPAAIVAGAAVLGYEAWQHFSSTPAEAHQR